MTKHERLQEVEKLLSTPMTYEQVGHTLGMARSTSRQYVDALYTAGKIHITDWIENGNKVFLAGPGPDAPQTRFKRVIRRRYTACVDYLNNPAYSPNRMLNQIMEMKGFNSDLQLAAAMGMHRARVCRLRARKENLSATFLLALHDLTGLPAKKLREMAVIQPGEA